MKLWVFRPSGHGPETFMVMATTEEEAIMCVERYRAKNALNYRDAWPEEYLRPEVYARGAVAVNDND